MKWMWVSVLVLVVSGFGYGWNRFSKTDSRVLALKSSTTLEERISALERRVSYLESGNTTKKLSGSLKENFVVLNGGQGGGYEWTKVSGTDFSFDLSLYNDAREITWQGWVTCKSCRVRLYDLTNNRAVDGSEVAVMGETGTSFYSKNMSIWRGKNDYYIQVKLLDGGDVNLSRLRLRVMAK